MNERQKKVKSWMQRCAQLVLPKVEMLIVPQDAEGRDAIMSVSARYVDFGLAVPNFITLKNLPTVVSHLNMACWHEEYYDVHNAVGSADLDAWIAQDLRYKLNDTCQKKALTVLCVEPIEIEPSPERPYATRHTLYAVVMPRLEKWELPS